MDDFRANKQNECQGRLGFALLQQSDDLTVAKLILYRTKSQILSTALLSSSMSLTFKQEYLQYTDDTNVFWSLNFTSNDEADVFLQELDKKCVVKRVVTEVATEAIATELPESVAQADMEPIETIFDASNKSNIVLRMAKVGQALPALSATNQSTVNDTDSLISSNGGNGDTDNTSLLLSSISSHSQSKPTNISVAVQPVPNYWHPSSTVSNYSSVNLNNFISENRVQNAEVRMNFSRMETKLERVMDNIEMLKLSGGRSTMRNGGVDTEDEIIKLEEKIVELKKNNRLLKLKLAESDSKESLVAAASVNPVNDELATAKQELETVNKDIEKLRQDKIDNDAKMVELEKKLKEETKKAIALANAKDELDAKLQELEVKLKAEIELKKSSANNVHDNEKLKTQIADLEKQLKEMHAKIAEHEQNGQLAQTKSHETIRSYMNKLYVELFQSVNCRDTLTAAEVLKLTAELIRRETKAALNQTTT